MSYTAEDKLPEDFFQETLKEKAEIFKKYIKESGNLLAFIGHIGPNMATFKFCLSIKEDSLKLHYTFSNLDDLKEQLYLLWLQLKYVLKGT